MYAITLRADDGTETEIKAGPARLCAAQTRDGAGTTVSVAWCQGSLATHDPDGYKALQAAWPGTGTLVISSPEDGESGEEPEVPEAPVPQPGPQSPALQDGGAVLFEGAVSGKYYRRGGRGDDGSGGEIGLKATTASDGGDGEEPEEPGEMVLTATPTEGDPMSIDFTVDNGGNPATIDPGDNSGEALPNSGDGLEATTYAYALEGAYNATATDDADPSRTAQVEVSVPAT